MNPVRVSVSEKFKDLSGGVVHVTRVSTGRPPPQRLEEARGGEPLRI